MRKKRPSGYWVKWENFEAEMRNAIKGNGGTFPSHSFLTETKRFCIINSANKYYGGLNEVRKKMGYGEKPRAEKRDGFDEADEKFRRDSDFYHVAFVGGEYFLMDKIGKPVIGPERLEGLAKAVAQLRHDLSANSLDGKKKTSQKTNGHKILSLGVISKLPETDELAFWNTYEEEYAKLLGGKPYNIEGIEKLALAVNFP